ncbi:GDP-mannose 4,6-dehydratase [Pseudoxanthomonas sp. UTMC 1351]|uniref:GDP-mannose 4,6-dehydratase n=1 Tax=Pseudoxanthomonas sp. UTMC 1351 TaxID=2695853 RepID=UPI0034CF2AA4
MKNRIALVTGAGGFTGKYVVEALSCAGYSVIAWSHDDASTGTATGVDLCDPHGISSALTDIDPDVVIHLAAVSFVGHSDIEEMYRVNIIGTRNLLKALAEKKTGPSRVILAGTANIYGNVEGIIGEDATPSPQNDYAVSKLAMESMAKLWANDLNITVVRPFNYTGVGQSERFLVPKIVSHFKRRAPILELGNIDVIRDFNDVRNVAKVYVDLAHDGERWETLNVCTGQEHSIRDILSMLEDITGFMPEITVNANFVRSNDVKRLVGDPARLKARLGQSLEFSMAETLRWMVEA